MSAACGNRRSGWIQLLNRGYIEIRPLHEFDCLTDVTESPTVLWTHTTASGRDEPINYVRIDLTPHNIANYYCSEETLQTQSMLLGPRAFTSLPGLPCCSLFPAVTMFGYATGRFSCRLICRCVLKQARFRSRKFKIYVSCF